MADFSKWLMNLCVVILLAFAVSDSVAAQTTSEEICSKAMANVAQTRTTLPERTILAAANLSGTWTASRANPFGPAPLGVATDVDRLFVAYLRAAPSERPGAVSIRIALKAGANDRPTNLVELTRTAIPRGINRCEIRGRPAMRRTVRVNQYIDYHNRGGANSSLEDFHFHYPVNTTGCERTDNTFARQTFAFEDVTPTRGDTLFARWFPTVATAYAVTHQYSRLRSEMHYRSSLKPGAICVGFEIFLKGREPVSIAVNEHGFGISTGVIGRSWIVSR